MRIALVQLPHFYGDGHSRPPENYPLGLGYVSAYLLEHGISHDGIDLWSRGDLADEALSSIDFGAYDLIGISAYATQYRYLRQLTLGLKERWPDLPVVCGGPGPTFSAETILRNTGVDVCVIGEGERTMLELVQHMGKWRSVHGIAFRVGDQVEFTDPRPYLRDLDSLPLPNRELFALESYMATASGVRANTDAPELRKRMRRAADLIAGRGCPYDCTFCSKTFAGCRLRKVDAIVAEIDYLQECWNVDHLQFMDELVITSKKRILDLCSKLKGRGLTWVCQGRIDQVDREILTAMKAAGCTHVGYGVESISQTILDAMDKRVKAEEIVPVIQMTREIGIEPIIQYMYGFPGENDETLAATERFFKEIDHRYIGFTTTPIPGSPLYSQLRQDGRLEEEHDYLMRLDSGYNLAGPLLNLTDMSDDEFLAKKAQLKFRVDHAYLSRRPLEYAKVITRVLGRKVSGIIGRV